MAISRKAEPSWVDGNAETRTYGVLKAVYTIKCAQQASMWEIEIYHISCTIDFTGPGTVNFLRYLVRR